MTAQREFIHCPLFVSGLLDLPLVQSSLAKAIHDLAFLSRFFHSLGGRFHLFIGLPALSLGGFNLRVRTTDDIDQILHMSDGSSHPVCQGHPGAAGIPSGPEVGV